VLIRRPTIVAVGRVAVASEWPDATNTGVPGGTSLTPSGGMTITTNGTTINALDVTGTIVVQADNVTIRNSKFTVAGAESISIGGVPGTYTGLVVEDCEFDGGADVNSTAISPWNFTIRRCNIYGGENMIFAEHTVTVEDCYLHDGTPYDPILDPHTDAIQIAENDATDITINHNTLYNDFRYPRIEDGGPDDDGFGNSSIQVGFTPVNITITNNKLGGTGYGLRMQKASAATNLVVTGNRWSQEVEVAAGWPTFTAGPRSGDPIYGGWGPEDGFRAYADAWSDNKYLDGPLAGTNV
jgi:hypothetical protein